MSPAGLRRLGRVIASSQKMESMIDNILAFSRTNQGDMRMGPVNLDRLLAQVVDDARQTSPHAEAQIDVGPLPEVAGDDAMLRQVFANLIDNALKFSASRSHARIEVGARAIDAATEIFVRDNGSVSIWRTPASCLACSSACTRRTRFRAPASGWPLSNGWWTATAAKSAQIPLPMGGPRSRFRYLSQLRAFLVERNGLKSRSGISRASPMEHAASRMFKPSQRMHSPEEFEGTGLGLSIVHRVMTCHGGKIWAQSRPAERAVFRFTLAPRCGELVSSVAATTAARR
jgi:light-regulated signal transduction histidine kinase (bacteriophytochrome)